MKKMRIFIKTMGKKSSIVFAAILTLAFCLKGSTVRVYAAEDYEVYKDEEQGIEYELYADGTCCVREGSYKLKEVIIPKEIEKDGKIYKVTKIRDDAFRGGCNLQSVTIPETVREIDEKAFTVTSGNNIVFHVKKGSYAEQFAKEYGYSYYGEDTVLTVSGKTVK